MINLDYPVGGSLSRENPFYVERQADREILEALQQRHYCYIFTSRQMGKSSLLVRSRDRLEQLGWRCCFLDLTSIGSETSTPLQWYKGITFELWRGFGLRRQIDFRQWWQQQSDLSVSQCLQHFVSDVLLEQFPDQPIAIFIDEIDTILGLSFPVDDFFSLIRFFYNQRALDERFQQLTIVLSGVATPSDLVRNKKRTPFNIGQAIDLTGFDFDTAAPLRQGLTQVISQADLVFENILSWTSGQPFLTQKLCRLIVYAAQSSPSSYITLPPGTEAFWVEQMIQEHLIQNWESQDEPEHLRTIRDRILRRSERAGRLLSIYQKLLHGVTIPSNDSREQIDLLLTGLVVKSDSTLQIKNKLYQHIFNDDWIQEQLADLRPYTEAFNAWITSQRTDSSRLLRGDALVKAQQWSQGKSLSDADYQFLAASQACDRAEVQQRLEAARLQEVEARLAVEHRRTLEQRKSLQRQRFLLIGVTVAMVVAIALGGVARLQYQQSILNEIRAIVRSAESLFASYQTFDALVEAITSQRRLQETGQSDPALRHQADAILEHIVLSIQQKNRLEGHSAAVLATTFSPDGQHIASGGTDTFVKIWNLDGSLFANLSGHRATIRTLQYSPDGKILASAGDDGTIYLWTADGHLDSTIVTRIPSIWGLSFSPDGRSLLVGGSTSYLEKFGLDGQQQGRIDLEQETTVRTVKYSAQGDRFAVGDNTNTATVWSSDGQQLYTLEHKSPVHSLAFSPDGDLLVTGSLDKLIRIWQRDGTLVTTLTHHNALVKELVFSPNGQEFLSASWDKTLTLWSRTGTLLSTLKGHQAAIWGADFSPDGSLIASASADHTIVLWQSRSPFYHKARTLSSLGLGAVYSHDGQVLAIAGSDYRIHLLFPADSRTRVLPAHESGVSDLSMHPTEDLILSASEDKTIRLWTLDGSLQRIFNNHDSTVLAIAWHPNGQEFWGATVSGQIYHWHRDGRLLAQWQGHEAPIWDMAVSPDGATLVTASNDGTLQSWSRNGQRQHTMNHGGAVWRVAFSPEGERVISGGGDATAKIWQLDGSLIHTLSGHQAAVWGVTFSPDGSLIATASIDETVKLWDGSGHLKHTLKGHESGVRSVVFHPEQKILASVGDDETVVEWQVDEILALQPIAYGCDWVADYLRHNPLVSDRHLCQGLANQTASHHR